MQTVNLIMPSKSDHKWCETTPIRPIIVSHLVMLLFGPPLFQLAFLGPHNNHYAPKSSAPLVVINRFKYLYLICVVL